MYYIDQVLFADMKTLSEGKLSDIAPTHMVFTTKEVESVPSELTEENGTSPDVLLTDVTEMNPINYQMSNQNVTIK